MSDHWSILVLAAPRAPWATSLTRWSTDGSLPASVVPCVSPAEVEARLEDGRSWSVLVVDGRHPGLERDLLDAAGRVDTLVVVVAGPADTRDWSRLGAGAVLQPDPTVGDVLGLLRSRALPDRAPALPAPLDPGERARPPAVAPVVAVVGPGGTGASTVAAALAEGLGRHHDVVLADLALRADQAMLQDAADIVPGVQELVEAHRAGHPDLDEVRAMTFEIPDRGHRLLAGLRRVRDWTVLRRRSSTAALDSLRAAFGVVVADLGPDLEGEAETGSADVEDRHLLGRQTLAAASVVLTVGHAGTKGVHSLVRLLGDIVDLGVEAERVVPVVNLAPRSRAARSEVTRALGHLLGADPATDRICSPMYLPRRDVERTWRDGGRLPSAVVDPVTAAVTALLWDLPIPDVCPEEPEPIQPGSLGLGSTPSDEEAA